MAGKPLETIGAASTSAYTPDIVGWINRRRR